MSSLAHQHGGDEANRAHTMLKTSSTLQRERQWADVNIDAPSISLVPRPSHVFNVSRKKSGRPGRLCDVMMTCGHYLGRGLKISAHSPTQTSTRMYCTAQRSTAELLAKGDRVERSVNKTAIEEALALEKSL